MLTNALAFAQTTVLEMSPALHPPGCRDSEEATGSVFPERLVNTVSEKGTASTAPEDGRTLLHPWGRLVRDLQSTAAEILRGQLR